MRNKSHGLLGGTAGVLAAAAIGLFVGRAILRHRRKFDLRNKVAVVTGASRGIGLEIARQLVRRGAKVVLCARDEAELRSAQEELQQLAGEGRTLAITADVTQPLDVANVVNQTAQQFGPIDVLVNNAGIMIAGPVSTMKLEDYRQAMDTNFFGAVHFTLAVMPEMRQRKSGRIVNIASFGGKTPGPHIAPYAAGKFALVGFSETLRTELAEDGVYVTTINPGFVRSGSMGNAFFKGDVEQEKAMAATADNLPVLSISPERLVAKVIDALEHGDAELTTPIPYKLQAMFHGLLPSVNQEVMSLINRLLPSRGTSDKVQGDNIADHLTPIWARVRQRNAEQEHQRTRRRREEL